MPRGGGHGPGKPINGPLGPLPHGPRHHPKPDPKPGHHPSPDSELSQPQSNAYDLFIGILASYGFPGSEEIAREVRRMIIDGVTDFQQIELGLRDTKAWQKRFAGNELRLKAGLNALSVSEYLSTEKSMADVLHNAGLPMGFYDDPADFAKWIGHSVSPSELASRVTAAVDLKNREDPAVTAELRRRGLSEGDITAYFLDPDRAMPILQKQYQSTLIGAAARRAGTTTDTEYADKLAGMGITEQQAAAGFGTVADITHPLKELGDVYGEDYNKDDAQAEVFENSAAAARKRKKISGQETAAFSGSSGTSQQSLGRSSAGSY